MIPGILRDFADLAPTDLDTGIDDALRRIGRFADVDRSYMFPFDRNMELMDNTHSGAQQASSHSVTNCSASPPT